MNPARARRFSHRCSRTSPKPTAGHLSGCTGRFPYRRSQSPFAAPRFVQQKGSLPPLPTWQPSVWSSFPVPPPPLRAEVDGKTGHGHDIFFLGIAMLPRSAEITGLLRAWSGGDQTALARISHRTGFLREGGEVQVTESRRDRRLAVAGGRKTACNATKRRIPTYRGTRPRRIPAQDDRDRIALPARQVLRRAGRTERGGGGTAVHLLPPRHTGLRGRARRRQRVLEFDEAVGHAEGRIDPGLRVRSRPARRGLRGLRLPSMGAVRESRARSRHGHSGGRRAQELQPATGARARPGAGTAQRARLPVRRADCDRAGDRWLALLVPASRSGHLGQSGQGYLSSDHGEHAERLLGSDAVPDEGAFRQPGAVPGDGRAGRGGTVVRAPTEGTGLPAPARGLPPVRAARTSQRGAYRRGAE